MLGPKKYIWPEFYSDNDIVWGGLYSDVDTV